MRKSARELELKFVLTRNQFDRTKAEIANGGAATETLHATYFDTPGCILRDNGLSLRIRKSNKAFLQTVKAETGVLCGLSNPVETETAVAGRKLRLSAIRDRDVSKRVIRLLDGQEPCPVFETIYERTTERLSLPGEGEAELALDKGVVKTDKASVAFCEAELELKKGSPEALLRAVDHLFAGEVPELGRHSKSELGYGLLGKETQQRLKPLKSMPPEFGRRSDCAAAFAAILKAAATQVLHNLAVVTAADDPEGPHQLRIGLRRLRTALKVLKPVLKREALPDLEGKLRDLAHLIGELRDADVQAADMVKPIGDHPGWGVSSQPLREFLSRRRNDVKARVRRFLDSGEMRRLAIEIALLPAIAARLGRSGFKGKSSGPVHRIASKALGKAWRKVAKRARRIDTLGIEERHRLRRDLKALRYTAEFFEGLYRGKKVKRFTGKLEKLQDILGYANDVAVAQGMVQALSGESGWNPEIASALSHVIGWRTAKAENMWASASASWRKLKRTPRFWVA